MAKKQVIRLTEGDLHNIIKESVNQILLERNIGEKCMTDDEVMNRRFKNFIDNYDDVYGDSIYNDEQENYRDKMNQKRLLRHKLTQNHKLDEVTNRLSEGKKKQKPRTGTIEMNGEHIRATEDGLDKYGNPMYKIKHPSIKGRKTKDGYTRVQHFNFKPDRVNESIYEENKYNGPSVKKVLNENDFTPTSHRYTPSWGDENRKKIEMQVSKDRQKARLKDCTTNTISDWLDVQFDEETGLTYVIDKNGRRENLCSFVLYHFVD